MCELKKNGSPIEDSDNNNEWDEIVIGQEAQVVPLFLVSIGDDPSKLKELWTNIPDTLSQKKEKKSKSKSHKTNRRLRQVDLRNSGSECRKELVIMGK